jgi:hypothetical protein
MKVTASGALEGSDAKTGRTQRDLCPHRSFFGIRTWWFVQHAHDVVALHQGESTTLSVTGWWPLQAGDGIACILAFRQAGQY